MHPIEPTGRAESWSGAGRAARPSSRQIRSVLEGRPVPFRNLENDIKVRSITMRLLSPLSTSSRRVSDPFFSRRPKRYSLLCESLETRQLLSTGTTVPDLSQITAQPSIEMTPMAGSGSSGLTPQEIQSAYGINQITYSGGITGNGTGQTIAIVDAYNDPNIAADLAAFDKNYNLPAPPSFTVDNLGAKTTDAGWSLETSLDVEWAHAIAPGANIVLVEASSASLSSLYSAVTAASHLAGVSVISMSWGTDEYDGEWYNNSVFTTPTGHTAETFVAASGDQGAWSGPTFPSVSPNVLAVGGTTLTVGSGNTYGSESGWSDSTGGFSGLDNGFQYSLSIPSYQVATLTAAGLNYGIRTTPDVSFNADPSSGVAVYDSVAYDGQSGWFQVGGTSAAAPAWAGLVAITDQGLAHAGKSTLSTYQLQTELYSLPSNAFHDITTGFNGYFAQPGYDLVTGLGTPVANVLVPDLLSASGVLASSSASQSASSASASAHASSNQHFVASSPTTGASGTSSNSSSVLSTGITAASAVASASSAQSLAALAGQSFGSQATVSISSQAQGSSSVTVSAAVNTIPTNSLGQGLSGRSAPSRWTIETDTLVDSHIDTIEVGQHDPSTKPERSTPAAAPTSVETPPSSVAPTLPSDLPSKDGGDALPATPRRSAIEPISEDPSEGSGGSASGVVPRVLGATALAISGYRFVSRSSVRERRRRTTFLLSRP
jgi:hypothetical protein